MAKIISKSDCTKCESDGLHVGCPWKCPEGKENECNQCETRCPCCDGDCTICNLDCENRSKAYREA